MNELAHLLKAIDNGDYSSAPYEHSIINNMFSEEFYQKLLDSLPEDKSYYKYKHKDIKEYGKDSPRLRLELDESFSRSLEDGHPLKEFSDILNSPELKDKIWKTFDKTIEKTKCWPQACLMRDKKGYKINPHPDKGKVATFLLYLPKDNSHEDVGTVINIKTENGFEEYSQAKYKRNSGFIFPVTMNSWHSVNTLGHDNFDRNVAMSLYYSRRRRNGWKATEA